MLTAGATPTAAQVKLGQNSAGAAALRAVSQAVAAIGVQNIAGAAATAGTPRYWCYMHEDAAGNQSLVVSSASFTVASAPAGSGTLTLIDFSLWTGSPVVSITVPFVKVCRISTGAVLLELAGQTVSAAGAMSIVNAVLTPGVPYIVFGFNADGSASFKKTVTAT